MIKIVTDKGILKQPIPNTPFTKEEQDLATAALLTAVTEQQGLGMSANQIFDVLSIATNNGRN